MTFQQMTDEEFAWLGNEQHLVYIRPVRAEEIVADEEDLKRMGLYPGRMPYSIHRVNGYCLGVLPNKFSAFRAAEEDEFIPVLIQ